MLESGADLFEYLHHFNLTKNELSWVLPRKNQKNMGVKLTGVIIAGSLTHQVIGETLSKEANVIIIPNLEIGSREKMMKEFAEVLYQENLFIISWTWQWIFYSKEGQAILAKLFHADYQDIYHESKMAQIRFEYLTDLTNILDRFSSYVLMTSQNKSIKEIKTKEVIIVFKYNAEIRQFLEVNKELIIIAFHPPDNYNQMIIQNKHSFAIMDSTVMLNEISREIYYYLKQNSYLTMDFVINREIRFEVK